MELTDLTELTELAEESASADSLAATISAADARAFGLTDGDVISLFQPRDEAAQAALARFGRVELCANAASPAASSPSTLLHVLAASAASGLPLPFTAADCVLRLGLLPE